MNLQGPWSEGFNRLSYFNPALTSWLANPPAAGLPNVPGLPGLKGDVALVSLNKRTAIPIDKKQAARRIGFANSVDPKTSSAAAGIEAHDPSRLLPD